MHREKSRSGLRRESAGSEVFLSALRPFRICWTMTQRSPCLLPTGPGYHLVPRASLGMGCATCGIPDMAGLSPSSLQITYCLQVISHQTWPMSDHDQTSDHNISPSCERSRLCPCFRGQQGAPKNPREPLNSWRSLVGVASRELLWPGESYLSHVVCLWRLGTAYPGGGTARQRLRGRGSPGEFGEAWLLGAENGTRDRNGSDCCLVLKWEN